MLFVKKNTFWGKKKNEIASFEQKSRKKSQNAAQFTY